MNAFIKENQDMLGLYAAVARIIGLIFILTTAFPLVQLLCFLITTPSLRSIRTAIFSSGRPFQQLLFGIIIWGAAQLIKYVSTKQIRPPWLLRNAIIILYLGALMIMLPYLSPLQHLQSLPNILGYSLGLIVGLARMMLVIGLANILKKLIPVIEEGKKLTETA